MRRLLAAGLVPLLVGAQGVAPPAKPEPQPAKEDPSQQRTAQRAQLNLLGQTDASQGESRRNENVQFNLIDTNTVKELSVRLGTTATLAPEFRADASYFSTEYGNRPKPPIHLPPAARVTAPHGNLFFAHSNSAFSARSFFQAGEVQPARENDYGVQFGSRLGKRHAISIDARQQKLRGQVNGNVLVPLASERTVLATDPASRTLIGRFLAAFPAEPPNRTDIDQRALNTNAPQHINTNNAGARWDIGAVASGRLWLSYQFTNQQVDAFQFVAGQNPDTDTHSHTPRITWNRDLSASANLSVTASLDRVTTLIRPEPNAVGPTVSVSRFITTLGPSPPIPIIRAQSRFQYGAHVRHVRARHEWTIGGEVARSQVNGKEQDGERGIFTFGNDFGRDAITNLRMGTASSYVQAIGPTHRGYRYWGVSLYAGDTWRAAPGLTINFGLRYQPVTTPVEVNRIDTVPYPCDCNNLAPRAGFAYELPGNAGRVRAAWGVHYGEIFATTFSQVRMNPPNNFRIVVGAPPLLNPLGDIREGKLPAGLLSGRFLVAPDMVTPYAQQYNFSWEPGFSGPWKLQLGYTGSRALKLFQMWFDNRAHAVAGIPQTSATINQRRADPTRLEVFRLVNASRAYFDAARITLIVPRRARFSGEASYWLSKSIDLGNDYTHTLAGADARTGRSQSEFNVHADLKAVSAFHQKHALLIRGTYDLPALSGHPAAARILGGWSISGVWLFKNGTPFSVESGSDGPGFGNVDGQGSDRVNLIDPSVLGRTIGNPDRSVNLLPRQAFAFIRPTDERGNLGRNTFRRGRISNVNSALTRSWRFGSERAVEFRAESINFLNTPQFAEPSLELASPSFAKITNTLNDGRTFRFQLRFRF